LEDLDRINYNQEIYCYIQEQKETLNLFIDKYNNDSIIHIFTSVIDSCEGNLFYCLGDIINNCVKTDGKLWFVTDIKFLYNIVQKLCGSFFEQVIYLEQGNKKEFDGQLDVKSLIDYVISIQSDKDQKVFMHRLLDLKDCNDVTEFDAFLYDLRNAGIKNIEYLVPVWCSFCEILLYGLESNNSTENNIKYKLTIYSILMSIIKNVNYTNAYLNEVLSDKSVNAENLYFVWSHFKRKLFTSLVKSDEKSVKMLDEIYERCYKSFINGLNKHLVKIPAEKRNKNLVVILTIQFLNDTHAPTRSVIERAKALKRLGRTVVIINTTEQYIKTGYIPIWNEGCGTVLDEYNNIVEIETGGDKFMFLQMPDNMSVTYKINILSQIINQLKPYYILSIGTGSILADLCGNIVPCASMSLVFSSIPKTENKMKILGRKLYPEEEKSYNNADIIESRFTFELRPQKKQFSRQELNLPHNQFMLVVVGIRLQYDVSAMFMEMLEKVCSAGCYIVFAGIMDNYNQLIEKYPAVSAASSFIGYCDDILALMDICDLYVNPDRTGGGFSIIEAFSKGVPGVYLQKGDVYAAGGEDFSVGSFSEMAGQIIRYKEDKDYYNHMSSLARERARLMTSSIEAMAELDSQICKRVEEKYW